ncbi:glycosyltransferase family 4 protein [Candidatus Bathyarchaeota archaeon]|nr:glycosyltransferase family 4 protein [Candidatus Bathyarchaeota archaeon]
MRILQVTPRYFPNFGGVEIVVKRISEMLVERGLSVTVYSIDLSSKTEEKQDVNGVLVRRFKPLRGDPLYLPPPSFIRALKREEADIVHVHNAHTLLPTLVVLLKRRRQRMLLQPHYHKFGQTRIRNLLLGLYKYPLDKLVFPRAEFVIANSPYEMRIIREDFPKCENVVLIREGISLMELKSVKWSPEKPIRVLYVGALRRYKNVGKLLEGFAYLVKEKEETFKLVIVGDGSEHERLVSLARKIGIEGYIEWKCKLSRKQLLAEYARAGVFVSLSQLESFSRVIHDAILIGVPTVVQNSGATADMVREGLVEGVDSLSPSAVADGIIKAVRKTPSKVSETQRAFLSWEEYLDKVLEIYKRTLRNIR